MREKSISVIIPSWNAVRLLKKNLPVILKVLPSNVEVIVIENGSADGSVHYLEQLSNEDSRVKPVFNKKNLGFIGGCNQGVKLAKGDFVALLNNDVIPKKDFLTPALEHFRDPEIFAVSFNEGKFGWAKIWWRGGFIHHGVGGSGVKSHISAWASGGSAIFRKSMWQKLGGFDQIYEPFYWEDVDLGYRAWKNGWKVIWEPRSLVEHHHESTISRLDKNHVDLIKERNQLIFGWRNISDFWFKLSQPLGVLLRFLTGPNYIKVIWAALRQYKMAQKRKAIREVRSDKEIISLFRN